MSTRFVLTNYVANFPNVIFRSWVSLKIEMFLLSFIQKYLCCQCLNEWKCFCYQLKSKQSNLKYLGIIFHDKLNWKPQIEKRITQPSKTCRIFLKLKHYASISVLRSVYLLFFHSYLNYSIFIGEEPLNYCTSSNEIAE